MPVSVSYFQKLTPKWGISETVTDENFNNYVFFFVLQETTHNLRAFRDLQHYTLAIFLQTQSISVFVFYHSKFAKFLPLQYLFQIIWIWIYFHKLKVKIPLPTAYQHYTVFESALHNTSILLMALIITSTKIIIQKTHFMISLFWNL